VLPVGRSVKKANHIQIGASMRDRANRPEASLDPSIKGEPSMRNFVMTLALAGVLVAGFAAAPALYAPEPHGPAPGPDGSMMGPDMQHMMNMMGQKSQMMDQCIKMMQGMMQSGMMVAPGSPKPNEH